MKEIIVIVMIAIAMPALAAVDPVAYGEISEVKSLRIGNDVVRYVKRYASTCLQVEVLESKGLTVKQSKLFCSFEGKSFEDGYADAGFQDIKLDPQGVFTELSLTPLQPTGEQIRVCKIPIIKGLVGELSCGSPIKAE